MVRHTIFFHLHNKEKYWRVVDFTIIDLNQKFQNSTQRQHLFIHSFGRTTENGK